MKTTFRHCKLCQKPIFRNEVEVSQKKGKKYDVVGRFHKYCANNYMKRKPHRYTRSKIKKVFPWVLIAIGFIVSLLYLLSFIKMVVGVSETVAELEREAHLCDLEVVECY